MRTGNLERSRQILRRERFDANAAAELLNTRCPKVLVAETASKRG